MSDWIEDHYLWHDSWEPWTNDQGFIHDDGHSVQHRWMNLATGARMVLIVDGGWRKPEHARFRLWAHYPGDGDVELTRLLERNTLNEGRYQTGPELRGSDMYVRVEASCVAYVKELLGLAPAEPATPTPPPEPNTTEPQTGFIEGLIQQGRAHRA